jgi:TrmH family RNA methyltransferase
MPQEEIKSLKNPRVKLVVKLRASRQRQRQGLFLIDGARELLRAMQAGVQLAEVFVCRPLVQSPESLEVVRRLERSPLRRSLVSPAVMRKLSFGERAEGVVGLAHTPQRSLEEFTLPANPLIAVLEGVEKPGNVGAVLRSADAAGVDLLVVADGGTDLYNPNAIRASLGTIFTVPVCATGAREALSWLRRMDVPIYTTRPDGKALYTQANLRGPAAIVLGSEATGLSDVWRAPDIISIKLPMRGAADSLNVSATAAVLFYEALRQRSSS